MRLNDYIALGWDQLKRRKVVTALCVIGIAIGSASIIVALAFGESIAHYAEKQMSFYLKTDEITIFNQTGQSKPGGAANGSDDYSLTPQKMSILRTLPHVKAIATYDNLQNFQFTVDDTKTGRLEVMATELDKLAEFGFEFQQGGPSDLDNTIVLSYAATLGIKDTEAARRQTEVREEPGSGRSREPLLSYPLYRKQIRLIKTVNLGNGTVKTLEFPVRVVGIEKRPEGASDDMLRYAPKTAYISHGLARQIKEAIAAANPQALSPESALAPQLVKVKIDQVGHVAEAEKLIRLLKLNTNSNLSRQENMKQEFVIFRLVFGGAGLFILFVASISIVVAMTMSTYQRRRQIGIMKVLGADLKQIRNMFVVESALLGLFGGLAGILISYWVIWGINILVLKFAGGRPGDNPEVLFISFWILPVGLFFALMTGVLSGIFPAIKASRTDALTAIKRE